MATEWGPLQALAGDWESDKGGLDTAFSHSKGKVLGTPYSSGDLQAVRPGRQRRQHLYGLDYKTAMWRGDEQNPFHTEVGYWLWDAATARSSGASSSRAGSPSSPGARRPPTQPSSPSEPRKARPSTASARTSTWRRTPARSATRSRSPGRHVVLRGGHDPQDARDGRAVRPHRRQHAPPGGLSQVQSRQALAEGSDAPLI